MSKPILLETINELTPEKNDLIFDDAHPCCNHQCSLINQKNQINWLHCYQINEATTIVICDICYQLGYRFCLVSHVIMHQCDMIQLFNGYHIQKQYHDQFNLRQLNQTKDVNQYLQMIGIDNLYPKYRKIKYEPKTDSND